MAELLYILHKFIGHKSSIGINSIEKKQESKAEEKAKPSEPKEDKKETKNLATKEPAKEVAAKKVLIAKKFPLSNKILSTLVASIGVEYDSVDNLDSLDEKIKSDSYDIIFTDEEYLTPSALELLASKKINVVLTDEPKDKQKFEKISIKTIKQLTSRDEIASIVNKFRDK